MVNLQIGALLQLTKELLPAMLQKQHGGILNVASVYAFSPVVFQAVYGACKSFLYSFSAALAHEVADYGVAVTVLCPGVTRTEFRSRAGVKAKKPGAGMSAEAVADYGFNALMRGRLLAVPGMLNKLFVLAARHLPAGAITTLLRGINRIRGLG